VILLHDNAPSHTAKLVKEAIEAFGWQRQSTNCQSCQFQIVEKMYRYRWAILRIKYFLSFSCNKHVFSIKKFQFHIYIPGITSGIVAERYKLTYFMASSNCSSLN